MQPSDKAVSATLFPKGFTQGDAVFITIDESAIPGLVELLREGCSIKYMTKKTMGPNKSGYMDIIITRTDR